VSYRESPPPQDLEPFIRRFWSLRSPTTAARDSRGVASGGAAAALERVVPDGRMEIIVQLGDPFSEWAPAERRSRIQPRALLAGQIDAPLYLLPGREVDLFAIRFEPWGAAALLRLSAAEMRGRIVALDAVLGTGADLLVHALSDARDEAGRERAAIAWCRSRRPSAAALDLGVIRAARLAGHAAAVATVADLAERAGTSTRQLERSFDRHIGLTPKLFLRIARLQATLAALETGRERPLATVALDCGYFDRSHLTREFLALVGTTPARFLRERRGLETLLLDAAPPAAPLSSRA
jgi:AraC-like DNA-binding protein